MYSCTYLQVIWCGKQILFALLKLLHVLICILFHYDISEAFGAYSDAR